MNCIMCDEFKKAENNPFLVYKLETGIVEMAWYQRFKGTALFICSKHVTELYQLPHDFMMKYLEEMALISEAVSKAFNSDKMNYELLSNGVPHLHWHLIPRHDGDSPQKGPIWWVPREEMYSDAVKPTEAELNEMVNKLRHELTIIVNKPESI
ncbi:MAG: hypothetical protein A2Y17_05300 [Clostridiales bacterium GWF2_38_85]|nr:MAG: hypothetical protein A2Y17_05300 [Clostridiales bacterium GWF2_38_85]HBL83354.1 HIT family protein [Clostridiales bacterium]